MPDADQTPHNEPSEWLVVPPTGHSGCPLEDWLGALIQTGLQATAKRDPEGLWIRVTESSLAGFVSLDKSMVEAINFELASDVTSAEREQLRKAVEKLGWEIWDQNSDDDDDWYGDNDDDD